MDNRLFSELLEAAKEALAHYKGEKLDPGMGGWGTAP